MSSQSSKNNHQSHKRYTKGYALAILVIVVSGLLYLAGSKGLLFPKSSSSQVMSEQHSENLKLFSEAANKRFHIKKADVLDQVDATSKQQISDTINRETMIAKLISEALDSKPEFVERAKENVLAKKPKILTLSQKIDNEMYQRHFIVSNTLACEKIYQAEAPQSLKLNDLFSEYCVDKIFDYPGGFWEDHEVEIKISEITERTQFEGLDNEFDKLYKLELRSLIISDFAQLYKTTGKLSYVE